MWKRRREKGVDEEKGEGGGTKDGGSIGVSILPYQCNFNAEWCSSVYYCSEIQKTVKVCA